MINDEDRKAAEEITARELEADTKGIYCDEIETAMEKGVLLGIEHERRRQHIEKHGNDPRYWPGSIEISKEAIEASKKDPVQFINEILGRKTQYVVHVPQEGQFGGIDRGAFNLKEENGHLIAKDPSKPFGLSVSPFEQVGPKHWRIKDGHE